MEKEQCGDRAKVEAESSKQKEISKEPSTPEQMGQTLDIAENTEVETTPRISDSEM